MTESSNPDSGPQARDAADTTPRCRSDRGGRSVPAKTSTTARAPAGGSRGQPPARLSTHADVQEFFAPQRTPADALPDPRPVVLSLVRGLLEVLAGVREVEQLARWFSEDAYRALVTRAALAARARSARNVPAQRPTYGIQSVRLSSPADGVVEATAIVSAPARTRAIALRLEGIDHRWRVTTAALL